MKAEITLETIRAAAAIDQFDHATAQERMAPNPRGPFPRNQDRPPKEAAVLILVYPEEDGSLHLVLTRRTDTLRGHSGQVSFPGGRCDPEDSDYIVTALRETCEELGICAGVKVLGMLSRFYIPPSHYNVYPVVGWLPEKPIFQPNPLEVAKVFSFALHDLLDDRYKQHEYHEFEGRRMSVPFYTVQNHKVWGATAVMLSEFEQRLSLVLQSNS